MNSFETIYKEMQRHNMKVPTQKVAIELPDARIVMKNALDYFLGLEGRRTAWLPEYEEVAKWLTNNEGRGLFLYGNCGRGKSMLVRYVLPAILLKYCQKVVSVYDMQELNKNIDLVLLKHIISLDDIGAEDFVNTYGNKRSAFAEVMDMTEKQGKLLFISTNLQQEELREKYGDRILDRIKATTKRVLFEGKSLR